VVFIILINQSNFASANAIVNPIINAGAGAALWFTFSSANLLTLQVLNGATPLAGIAKSY